MVVAFFRKYRKYTFFIFLFSKFLKMFQNQRNSSPEGAKKERLFRLFSAFYAIVGQSNTPQIRLFTDLEPYGANNPPLVIQQSTTRECLLAIGLVAFRKRRGTNLVLLDSQKNNHQYFYNPHTTQTQPTVTRPYLKNISPSRFP